MHVWEVDLLINQIGNSFNSFIFFLPIGDLFLFFNETVVLLWKCSTLGNPGGFCLRHVEVFEIDIFKDGQGILIFFYFGDENEQFDDWK